MVVEGNQKKLKRKNNTKSMSFCIKGKIIRNMETEKNIWCFKCRTIFQKL